MQRAFRETDVSKPCIRRNSRPDSFPAKPSSLKPLLGMERGRERPASKHSPLNSPPLAEDNIRHSRLDLIIHSLHGLQHTCHRQLYPYSQEQPSTRTRGRAGPGTAPAFFLHWRKAEPAPDVRGHKPVGAKTKKRPRVSDEIDWARKAGLGPCKSWPVGRSYGRWGARRTTRSDAGKTRRD